MALFRNYGVNRRNRLCGIQEYASAQFLDFHELAKNCTFLDRKLISALYETADGHYIKKYQTMEQRHAIVDKSIDVDHPFTRLRRSGLGYRLRGSIQLL